MLSMTLLSLFWMLLLQCCSTITYRCNAQTLSKFPAILVFGDSTVDTGNNNYIITIAKSNYPPYGIDFLGHVPTGRYSNGKLVPDILGSMLGLKETIPPFLQPNISDHDLLTGVCFASAGSGFDDQTTAISRAIPMSKQPELLVKYIERLKRIVGEQVTQRIVNEALVIISAGTVDMLNNFYIGRSIRRLEFSISEYHDFLLNNVQDFLKKLHGLGCRKMHVSGLPPIGCLPLVITANSPLLRACIAKMNSEAESYNEKLIRLLPLVEEKLPSSKIVYADVYNPLMDMIKNPKRYGFVQTTTGCCGTGLVEVNELCNPLVPACKNRSQHLFWDSVHPSESAFSYLAKNFSYSLAK